MSSRLMAGGSIVSAAGTGAGDGWAWSTGVKKGCWRGVSCGGAKHPSIVNSRQRRLQLQNDVSIDHL
jgi:hypothetical protein